MSWGYKLTFTFTVFAAMMGYMVYRCFGSNFELVEKEYYKSELRYQDVIDGTNNASALSALPAIQQTGKNILLQLPVEMKKKPLSGSVFFYCAYDSRKDRKIVLAVDENGAQSLGPAIAPGIYTVKFDWHSNTKNYYAEQVITIL